MLLLYVGCLIYLSYHISYSGMDPFGLLLSARVPVVIIVLPSSLLSLLMTLLLLHEFDVRLFLSSRMSVVVATLFMLALGFFLLVLFLRIFH